MDPRLIAIVWAQWRSIWNMYPRANKAGILFTSLGSALWYGAVAVGAVIVGRLVAMAPPDALVHFLPFGLLFAFLFWQIVPLVLASTGATLDVRKLMVYPVPHRHLFAIEVLLRLTTGVDVLIIMLGAAGGLLFNSRVSWWAPAWFLPFVLFNMTLSAGIRDLLARLFARKRFREVAIFALVLLAALPQLVAMRGIPAWLPGFAGSISREIWPWSACGKLSAGQGALADAGLLAVWAAAGYLFGRWQFEIGLRFDQEAAEATPMTASRRWNIVDRLYAIPSALLPDPIGALVEKEVRFLSRAPRFRLVFLMGFSFGLLIWMPLAFGRHAGGESFMKENFLTLVSVYALMLLGEVAFWNMFGFDRSAAQVYFLAPVRFSTVLAAKNIVAAFFVLLEILLVTAVCLLFRLALEPAQIVEALLVTAVLLLYFLSIGNLSSTHFPSPVDPSQSWRSRGAGRFHLLLLVIYPLVSIPVGLAYLARWAFDSQAAFYMMLVVAAGFGALMYWVAMESAVAAAHDRREKIISELSQGQAPVSLG